MLSDAKPSPTSRRAAQSRHAQLTTCQRVCRKRYCAKLFASREKAKKGADTITAARMNSLFQGGALQTRRTGKVNTPSIPRRRSALFQKAEPVQRQSAKRLKTVWNSQKIPCGSVCGLLRATRGRGVGGWGWRKVGERRYGLPDGQALPTAAPPSGPLSGPRLASGRADARPHSRGWEGKEGEGRGEARAHER